jgi:hypothetical protein
MKERTLGILRSQDQYGEQMKFTYKGEDTVKSAFGGFFSLLGRGLILYLIYSEVTKLYNREVNFETVSGYTDVVTNPSKL